MSKITIRDIRDRYLVSKEEEKKFKWTYYIRRPVSYYLAWFFLKLGVSATKVTVIWLIVAAIGCLFIASGNYLNTIIGTSLLEFAVILDCVDGHIARLTRSTRVGQIMDTWTGEILLVSSLFSIGIGLSNNSGELIAGQITKIFGAYLDNLTFLYLGFLTALASLSSWTVRLHWRTITQKLSLTQGEPDKDLRESKKVLILDNLFHYSGALTIIMLVSAISRALDVFLIVFSIIVGVYLIGMMYRILRKARSLESDGTEEEW